MKIFMILILLTLLVFGIIGMISYLSHISLHKKLKKVYWKDDKEFFFRRYDESRFGNGFWYIYVYRKVQKSFLGFKYVRYEFIRKSSTWYSYRQIDEVNEVKDKLDRIISSWDKENKGEREMMEWDGSIFKPTKRIIRDRKLDNLLGKNK